ncbi:PREDICTED: disease resistance protein TAO1-like [Camelina sativa]|uniref:ADP-ribosyl cyclase/cyclic ADP-ribose hydrolase n=1 Tax=Camelina sativa TaxID=90675 RepID=A0ABM1R726_CAMSA|nr:PREDICTED: disease resistance protein TAO1-like [Camelina sativa]
MASSSYSLSLSFTSSSLLPTWEHDVFTSFHGKDVRKSFLSHVLKEFKKKAIKFFLDNEMERGKFIGPELKQAIRGSKIAVVLLSKNYASSSWCLDELVKIMKYKKKLGQTVITIFYEVDPTDVKKQKGDFGKAFKETCQGKTEEKIQTWTKALKDVATIAGYHSNNWNDEATMIENIATDISKMLNHLTPSRDFDHLIGMGAHKERMNGYLRLDLHEVRMIGIWGPAGIGKTTIARFLFNQLSGSFQNSAFMVNIRVNYPRPCLDEYSAKLKLQGEMLSQMIYQKDIVISHLGVAEQRLRHITGLLVLDDVDRLAQLEALAKNVEWFGPRSRIIITTEDLRLLKAHGIEHIYKVDFPSNDEALQMFCMYAFNQKTPEDGFDALARKITYLVGELPLGLKVIGSHFRGLSKEEWPMEVSKLRTNLNGDIMSILKFSYDALCAEDQDLFLHIACFFNDRDIEIVKTYLAEKFKYLSQRLYSLEMKSLISIVDSWSGEFGEEYNAYINMHNLLVQLGKEIVCKQSATERQIFFSVEDSCEVYTTKAFEEMYNLQYLNVNNNHLDVISSPGSDLNFVSPKLRLLYWSDFPMTCLHFTHNLEFLVEIRMIGSKLEKLWDETKLLPNLKLMDLSSSKNLKELSPSIGNATNLKNLSLIGCSSLVKLPPSIGNATNLEKLNLCNCSSLVKLPPSIGNATNLHNLDLSGCSSLVELSPSIGNATNLEELNLSKCSSLVELPPSIGNATNLFELNLRGCSSLLELPSSIGNLTRLWYLYLDGCISLVELPSSIGNLTNLHGLDLRGCLSLVELPSSIWNATQLDSLDIHGCSGLLELPPITMDHPRLNFLFLSGCSSVVELPSSIDNLIDRIDSLYLDGWTSLVELPSSIGNVTRLTTLYLQNCSSLVELPSSIRNLTNLKRLHLDGCSSLVSLPKLPDSLRFLKAENCESLEKLDCSFCNPSIWLNFVNCFKLNQEARDLLIETSTDKLVILPGKEVPACFTHRGYGSSVTVKLNQKPLRTSTKFKA